MLLKLIEQLSLSFITSVGFAVIMLVPKNAILYSGLSGMGGWFIYWLCNTLAITETVSTFLGALTIAALSYLFARIRKTPATIYNIPGIVALVPGGVSYKMTYSLISGKYTEAMSYGIQVAAIAGAIAAGLIVFDLGVRLVKRRKKTI